MVYDFALPFSKTDDDTYQKDAHLLAKSTKSTVISLVEKTAPAHIAVVGYKDKSFTGTTHFLSNKFFLQGISEAGQEKLQVIETFGKAQLLFFDQRMRAFNFRGLFVDADDPEGSVSNYWADAFRLFYEEHLRGTRLVDNDRIAVLTVNNQMYIGYPTTLQLGIESQRPLLDTFNMTWAIVNTTFLPPLTAGTTITSEGVVTHLNNLASMFKLGSIDLDPAKTRAIEDLNREIKEIEDEIARLSDISVGLLIVAPQTEEIITQYAQTTTELEKKADELKAKHAELVNNR